MGVPSIRQHPLTKATVSRKRFRIAAAAVGVALWAAIALVVVARTTSLLGGSGNLRLHGREYARSGTCLGASGASVDVTGEVEHVPARDVVRVSRRTAGGVPAVLYLWRDGSCVSAYDLQGGP